MKVGLNLYSIRGLVATEEAFTETAIKLKKMGYDVGYVGRSGFEYRNRYEIKTKDRVFRSILFILFFIAPNNLGVAI